MKKWTVPCAIGSQQGSYQVYLGAPASGFHPLHFQAAWLRERMGGIVADEAMEEARRIVAPQGPRPQQDKEERDERDRTGSR